MIEPAEDICLFKKGAVGIFILVLLSSGLKQIVGCDLKGVLQQRIELFQISVVQFPHLKFSVCL